MGECGSVSYKKRLVSLSLQQKQVSGYEQDVILLAACVSKVTMHIYNQQNYFD
jgi:hypothetical protein